MDVSIIIPAHNRLWCLPHAVESCRNTTQCSIEIIVVDDGSTDGTWQWLQTQKDIIALKQWNWGKPFAVNLAFERATGKYIRFLDSDDWLLPGAIDEQFKIAEEAKADLVVSGHVVYDEHMRFVKECPWQDCDDFVAQCLGECDSSHYSAFLFTKELVGDIPHRTSFASADFAVRDDRCLILEVALKNPRYVVHRKPALGHRFHRKRRLQFPCSLRADATNLQHYLIYRTILGALESRGELTPRRRKAAVNVLWPLAHWIAKSHLEDGVTVAQWVYELDPDFEPPNEGLLGTLYRHAGFRATERFLSLIRPLRRPFLKKEPHVEKPVSAVEPGGR